MQNYKHLCKKPNYFLEKMATSRFYISKKVKKGLSEIILRFSYRRGCTYRLRTGFYVPATAWNEKKGKLIIPRMHTVEQVKLSRLQTSLEKLGQFLATTSIEANGHEDKSFWEQKIAEFKGVPVEEDTDEEVQEESIGQAFDKFIDSRTNNDMRHRQMDVVKRILLRFNKYIRKELKITDWNDHYLCQLEDFLKIEYTFFDADGKCLKQWERIYVDIPETRRPKQRGGNAIFSIMKRFRTFCNWCVLTGRLTVSPFKQHPLKECVYGTPFFLTTDEMTQLYKYDFSDNPKLAVQRDIFVLQSNLGMRIGDYYSLTTANLIQDAIEYIPSKTLSESGKVARIPLTARAKEILERYRREDSQSLVPLISEQHYNKAIKEMLRLAGINRVVTTLNPTNRIEEKHPIWEVASSHMARRNFIGNLYAKVKDPDLISSMTGHVEGSKAFSRYRTIDDSIKRNVLTALE